MALRVQLKEEKEKRRREEGANENAAICSLLQEVSSIEKKVSSFFFFFNDALFSTPLHFSPSTHSHLDTREKRQKEVSSQTSPFRLQFMPPEAPLQPGTVTATLTASTAAAKATAAKARPEASAASMSMSRERTGSGEGAPSTPSSWSLGALFQASGGGTSEADLRTMRNR